MLKVIITKTENTDNDGFTYSAEIFVDEVWCKSLEHFPDFGVLVRCILTDKELCKN